MNHHPIQRDLQPSDMPALYDVEQQRSSLLDSESLIVRGSFLDGLPHEGWQTADDARSLRYIESVLAASGLPLEGLRSVNKVNGQADSEGDQAAEMVTMGENLGRMNIFAGFFQNFRARGALQARVVIHELAHRLQYANSDSGTWLGGEAMRQRAHEFVSGVALNSAMTGIYLNGQHARAAKNLVTRKISSETYLDEVFANIVQMGLTDRDHLVKVYQAQQQIKQQEKVPAPLTELVTGEGNDPKGVDEFLLPLLAGAGVRNMQELRAHTSEFSRFVRTHEPSWIGSIALRLFGTKQADDFLTLQRYDVSRAA